MAKDLENTTDLAKLPLDFRVLFGYKEIMDTEVDDKVKVWAFFDQGIFPIAMNWNRRFVKFDKVIFSSSRRVGDSRMVDLVCASDTANFELEYNANNYIWKVKKVTEKV